jgi:hypothetical protein
LDTLFIVLRWAWVLSECALIFLLVSRKLWSRYRWFTSLIAVGLAQQMALLPFDYRSWTYVKLWAVFELIRLVVLCGATLELTKLILEYYPKLAHVAASGFGLIFALGICIGTGSMALFIPARANLPVHAHIAMQALRWVSFSITGYLLGMALWFSVFPIRMRRNVVLHRWLLALYGGLIPGWAVFMTDVFTGDHAARTLINLVMMGSCTLCLWVWCVRLTQTGEEAVVEARPAGVSGESGGAFVDAASLGLDALSVNP